MQSNIDTKDEKINSLSKAVKIIIDELPDGYEFSGKELKKLCNRIAPDTKGMYIETALRIMRKFRRSSCLCINRRKSIYKKIKVVEK